MASLLVENDCIAGVPVTVWARQGLRAAPLVFFVHGFTGERSTGAQPAWMLAQAGFRVVCVDAAMHGERLDERVRDTFSRPMPDDIYPFESGLDRWWMLMQIADRTAADISGLIDRFAADPDAGAQGVGVFGVSMGGFVTHLLAARDPRVCSAAALISLAQLAGRWNDLLVESSTYPRWAASLAARQAESERRLDRLRELDPVLGLKQRFAPRPLLMICGDVDTDIPKSYSVRLYQELLPLYAGHEEDLKLSIHDGITHRVTSAMWLETTAWFQRTLQP